MRVYVHCSGLLYAGEATSASYSSALLIALLDLETYIGEGIRYGSVRYMYRTTGGTHMQANLHMCTPATTYDQESCGV